MSSSIGDTPCNQLSYRQELILAALSSTEGSPLDRAADAIRTADQVLAVLDKEARGRRDPYGYEAC